MRGKIAVFVASTLYVFATTGARVAFAESRWITTSGGTFDWNNSANWSGSFPPASVDDVRITNDLGSAQLITNMGGASAIGKTNIINFLSVSNGLGSTSVTVEQAPGVLWQSNFGIQLGKNATLVIVTNAIMGTNANLTFDLRAGGQPGTLVLSNASTGSGFSAFVNSGGMGINNSGTIQFTPVNSQLVSINYGQTGLFTNNALGTVVMHGSGTGAFVGNFGSNNERVLNNGSIFVQSGTLRVDSRNAFSGGGFQNGSTGYIEVDAGGTFELRRTTNAWTAGTAVTNLGTIFMSGGTMLAFDTDQNGNPIQGDNASLLNTNTSRVFENLGIIKGNGTISATISNLSGSTLAPGFGFQTLNVGGSVGLGSNSTLSIELGTLTGQNDLLAVGSNLTMNANSILALTGGAAGNVYTVATFFADSGIFSSVTPGYTIGYNPTDITVQLIPEPSTLLLVATGLAGLIFARRRRPY